LKCDTTVSHFAFMLDVPDNDAPAHEGARYAIGDLAEAAGVSRRAVRFYVQRGLLAPPLGGGRGAFYTGQHLERLRSLKRLQEAGLPLEQIARTLDGDDDGESHPPGAPRAADDPWEEPWMRLSLAPGVELAVQPSRVPAAQRRALVDALRGALRAGGTAGGAVSGAGKDKDEARGEGRRARVEQDEGEEEP
jgi:DNA-binding transcriptional MerR regulator